MRTTLGIGALAVVTAGAVAVLLPPEPGPQAPLRPIDLGVQSPATQGAVAPPAAAVPVPSGPAGVPQAPVPAPEPAPMPDDDAENRGRDDRDRDDRVEVGDDRDAPDEPDEPDDD